MFTKLLLLAIGGALGTLSRFGVITAANRLSGGGYPFGTIAANALGCFIAGAAIAFFEKRFGLSKEVQLFVMVGFLGAFTTFSAFIVDAHLLFKTGGLLQAGGYLFAQNALGIVALLAGVSLARAIAAS